jgi:solute carrier family 6 amino acid/orphan transporter-like 15/16/17/18/20
MGLTLIAFTEIMTVMYVYGHKRFTDDIEEMTGVRPGLYWQIMWRFVAPILIAGLVVFSAVSELLSTPKYAAWNKEEVSAIQLFATKGRSLIAILFQGKSYMVEYPGWSMWFALCLALSSIVPIAVIALLRSMKIRVLEINTYSSHMHRTETSASTRPMMQSSSAAVRTWGV